MEENPNAPLLTQKSAPLVSGTAATVLKTVASTAVGAVIGAAVGIGIDTVSSGAVESVLGADGHMDLGATVSKAALHYAETPSVQIATGIGAAGGAVAGSGVLGKWTKRVNDERANAPDERGL